MAPRSRILRIRERSTTIASGERGLDDLRRNEAPGDDVEGHARKRVTLDTEEGDEVEGHARKRVT